MAAPFTQEFRRKLADAYASGMTAQEVGEKHGVHLQSVLNAARAFDVEVRPTGSDWRKHHFDLRFFSRWSPDMAYVLGFAFADGSVTRRYRHNELRLYQKEPQILDDIRPIIGFTGPYYMCGTDREIHALVLHSKVLVEDIALLGLHPAKSLTCQVPTTVEYPRDFVRGYFDGDGHGGRYKKRKQRILRIGFSSGSREFLVGVKKLLPCKIGGPYESKGCFSLLTNAERDAFIIRDWMYAGDSTLHITRKRKKLYS